MRHTKYPGLAIVMFFVSVACCSVLADQGMVCGQTTLASGTYTMEHGGHFRTFRLQLPASHRNTDRAPLIVMFHGWGGNENEFIGNETVRDLADQRGYVLLAPRGLGSGPPDNSFNSWSFRGSTTGLDGDGLNTGISGDTAAICDAANTPDYSYGSCQDSKSNTCSWTHCQDNDLEFVLALIEKMKTDLCLDPERIFATGGSNGGMFTWDLGQNPASAPIFRAIAPLIGLPHRGYLDAKGKPGDLPVLLITGTEDTTVPPGAWEDASFTSTSNDSDRYFYTGASAITRSWAESHGCNTNEAAAAFDEGFDNVDCRSYCSSETAWPRVLDCRVEMGHSYEFAWSWELTLNFFDAHSRDRPDDRQAGRK